MRCTCFSAVVFLVTSPWLTNRQAEPVGKLQEYAQPCAAVCLSLSWQLIWSPCLLNSELRVNESKKKTHYISACPWQEVTEQNTKCHTSTCGMHNRKRDTAAVNQNITSCCSLLAVKLYYTLIYSFEGQFTPTSMIHVLLLCVVLSSHLYCFSVSCRVVEMSTISSI